jgi:hypothetical protein
MVLTDILSFTGVVQDGVNFRGDFSTSTMQILQDP